MGVQGRDGRLTVWHNNVQCLIVLYEAVGIKPAGYRDVALYLRFRQFGPGSHVCEMQLQVTSHWHAAAAPLLPNVAYPSVARCCPCSYQSLTQRLLWPQLLAFTHIKSDHGHYRYVAWRNALGN